MLFFSSWLYSETCHFCYEISPFFRLLPPKMRIFIKRHASKRDVIAPFDAPLLASPLSFIQNSFLSVSGNIAIFFNVHNIILPHSLLCILCTVQLHLHFLRYFKTLNVHKLSKCSICHPSNERVSWKHLHSRRTFFTKWLPYLKLSSSSTNGMPIMNEMRAEISGCQ